jgi:hypothetical protein
MALCALAATAASAQSVTLELHPGLGDTLRMRLEQQVEMTGTMRVGGVDSTTTVVTTLRALTHSVVERSDASGTVLASTTDSVHVVSTGGSAGRHGTALSDRARRALEGRTVRLRVAPDGSTEVLSQSELSPDLAAFFSQMPATLPRGRVAVGDVWTRKMDMPGSGKGYPGGGVSATFRLDSLTRGGSLAFVSMRGTVTRSAVPAGAAGATRVVGGGSLVGVIVIDQRRKWLAEARTTLTVRSTLTPPAQSGASPMRFHMRVQEWLRAADPR